MVAMLAFGSIGVMQAPVATAAAAPLMPVTQIVSGDNHTCALLSNGTVRCWGDRQYGQLGAEGGSATCASLRPCSTVPVVVQSVDVLSNVVSMSASARATCALRSDTTVWCWGDDAQGELGAGQSAGTPGPVEVRDPTGLHPLTGVARISSGGADTCAVLVGETADCWGSGVAPSFGDNSTIPVVMKSSNGTVITHVVEMKIGSDGSICTLFDGGTATCAGLNTYGQLGNGTTTSQAGPVVVKNPAGTGPLTGIADLTIGHDNNGSYVCARMSAGTADCWGVNDFGQLGAGTSSGPQTCALGLACSDLPVAVRNEAGTGPLTGIADIQAGFDDACARLTDGTMRCWGTNGTGELGDGTTTTRTLAIVVQNSVGAGPLQHVTGMAVGSNQTCAVISDGSAACWGSDLYGQLGDGTNTNSPFPATVQNGGMAVTSPPNAPTGVTALGGFQQASVSWSPPANDNGSMVTAYIVTASPGGETTEVSELNGPVTTAIVPGLTGGLAYTFTVRSVSLDGDSPESAPSSPITPSGPPGAPVGLSALPGSTTAKISWRAPTNPGSPPVTGYVVTPEVSDSNPVPPPFTTTSTNATVGGLTAGEGFSFTVAAVTPAGTGPAAQLASEIVIGLPTAPKSVAVVSGAANVTTGSLVVSYAAGPSNGSVISRFTATCASPDGGATRTGTHQGATAVPITVTGVTTRGTYRCRVTAYNEGSPGAPSASSSPVIAGAPRAPTKPILSATTSTILKVSFGKPANDGAAITGYTATCKSSNGGVARAKRGPGSPISVTGLTPGRTYTCTVVAANTRGSGPSSPVSASITA